jgi:glutamine amidotransferase
MCRILAYLGPELPLEDLLLKPCNSLVNQSKAPEHHPLMQLSGWGFACWSKHFLRRENPFLYRRPVPAFFDDNITGVIPSLRCHTALAHVRATTYTVDTVMADENCHPFLFEGTEWALVHNGFLPHLNQLKRELLSEVAVKYLDQIDGTTDTEFIYALLLSHLRDDSIDAFQKAFEKVLKLIVDALRRCEALAPTKLKLALASPHSVIAVNYGSGFKGETEPQGDWRTLREAEVGTEDFLLSTILEPLYLLAGRNFQNHGNTYDMDACEPSEATSAILASEPLTAPERWIELPFGCMLRADFEKGTISTEVRTLNL